MFTKAKVGTVDVLAPLFSFWYSGRIESGA